MKYQNCIDAVQASDEALDADTASQLADANINPATGLEARELAIKAYDTADPDLRSSSTRWPAQ